MKPALGIIIAFTLGFCCRLFGIPSPAPPAFIGALLVLAMTFGYIATDWFIVARSKRRISADHPKN
jgi:XapX domain-containing protein